ncbi:hypothetical protein P280DRAFT_517072 [Massarina eburnea CBS 473.64]|uniref:F-box domain-containing protein n=1 Tax=Massarina eburnea CBS 473.64 TaxID=1395130 RepID=A0A6A6S2G8_9PLEO|nr:hypothetical protein P280DRAFT_517072 [Massarina eburnea CBS 473.64]
MASSNSNIGSHARPSYRDIYSDSSESEVGQASQANARRTISQRSIQTHFRTTVSDPSSLRAETTAHPPISPSRSRGARHNFNLRSRRRGDGSSTITAPSRADSAHQRGSGGRQNPLPQAPLHLEDDFEDDLTSDAFTQDFFDAQAWAARTDADTDANANADTNTHSTRSIFRSLFGSTSNEDVEDHQDYTEMDRLFGETRTTFRGQSISSNHVLANIGNPARKRTRESLDMAVTDTKVVLDTLNSHGVVAVLPYSSGTPDPRASDIWPNLRDSAKLPTRYYRFNKSKSKSKSKQASEETRSLRRPTKILKTEEKPTGPEDIADEGIPAGHRSVWNLPVELMAQIAGHLNRDDIKSMRLVSRELDYYVSQVIFRTVVVPFNTEIYGMIGEQKLDLKGKKKAKVGSTYTWTNANGDDVYNGHGLDVFKGFGKHILRFGMSFEVNEDALAKPPEKLLTEKYTSFWGSYHWPLEEYCRFADVAGLETAADETPRMKTAFSELSRVNELALSIDSGLGWLSGPDRSIRTRILQRSPKVFGAVKDITDRRAQAQQELWEYIESCHRDADKDIKLATLYKLEAAHPLKDLQELCTANHDQPEIPFLDPHVVQSAVPYDVAESELPTSFEDLEVLDRFVSAPESTGAGVLFSSESNHEIGQLMSPIIPSHLTHAQKEWLLETEWAQRAFLSSYMLSIIDNPTTFERIHTLNIARLSDRYIPMLNRNDFWDSLPNLKDVTLMAIPGWRTVNKDEAGFVETPKINPAGGIDPFYELLDSVISPRRNITRLTVGWATGGEHAEGVHARNRLILPAPLLTYDKAITYEVSSVQEELLEFEFVEHLTLKNCWITPLAVLQFVELHDKHNLQHLVFDSVSMTAMPRPSQHLNGHHANGGANNHVAAANHLAAAVNPHAAAVAVNQLQAIHAAHQAHQNFLLQAAPPLPLPPPPPHHQGAQQVQHIAHQLHHGGQNNAPNGHQIQMLYAGGHPAPNLHAAYQAQLTMVHGGNLVQHNPYAPYQAPNNGVPAGPQAQNLMNHGGNYLVWAPHMFGGHNAQNHTFVGNHALNNAFQGGNQVNLPLNQPMQGQPPAFNPGQLFLAHIQAVQQQVQHIQNQAGPAFNAPLNALQTQLQAQNQLAQLQANGNAFHQAQVYNNQAATLNALVTQVNAIQQQLIHHFAAQNAAQNAAHNAAQQVVQPPPNPQTALKSAPREGSWMNVIDIVTPGPNLSDFGSHHSKANEERTTNLQSIEFISCGYVSLPYNGNLDQQALNPANGVASFTRHPAFTKRYATLAPAMLSSKWPLLASIVPYIDATEMAALNAGWFLESGWADAEEATAVEFDGGPPGGTGRFTGIVRKEDKVQTAETS